MPIPKGYLPRKGDIVLVQARAKRDAYPNEPEIQCYFEVVGQETAKFFMSASEIHSIYARNWSVGDEVMSADGCDHGVVVATMDDQVWVKVNPTEDDPAGFMGTFDANMLEPYVEPTVKASDFVSVDVHLDGVGTVPNEALLIAPVEVIGEDDKPSS
jgi:hypothetical protein